MSRQKKTPQKQSKRKKEQQKPFPMCMDNHRKSISKLK